MFRFGSFILFISIILASYFTCNGAGKDSILDGELIQLRKLSQHSLILLQPNKGKPLKEILNTSAEQVINFSLSQIQAERLKKDLGLSAIGSFTENFAPSLAADDDNLFYQRRLQAGVNWSLLNNGYIENKRNAEKLSLKGNIEEYDNKMKQSFYSEMLSQNLIRASYNNQKLVLLQQRESKLKEIVSIMQSLYYKRYVSYEDLLEFNQRLTETSSQLYLYNIYSSHFNEQNSVAITLVPLDLNIKELSDKFIAAQDSTIYLNEKFNNYSKTWYDEVNLSTSLRYNVYAGNTLTGGARNYLSAGINLSVPFHFDYEHENKIVTQKNKLFVDEKKQEKALVLAEIVNECYEYAYKHKQVAAIKEKIELNKERIRKLQDLESLEPSTTSLPALLKLQDDHSAILIEWLDLAQDMDLKLGSIYFKSRVPLEDFTSQPVSLTTIDKSLYIWSSSLKEFPIDFIASYIRQNNYTNVIASCPNDTSKFISLAKTLRTQKVQTELLIGNNKLLFDNSKFAFIPTNLKPIISTLHLDVEPHVLDEWKTDKENVINNYKALLTKTKQLCQQNNIALAASIPLHYDESLNDFVKTTLDKIYLMAYENVNAEYLVKKIKRFDTVSDKIIICLRVEDFKDLDTLNKFIKELQEKTSVNNFAVHDFKRLIKMQDALIIENRK